MIPFYELERYEGNEALFDLVMMSVVSTYAGETLHLHAEGLRGTGKTTIMRAAQDILPDITRIKGCMYNCDPEAPHCPVHRKMSDEEILALGTEQIPMPFLEISHSAKIGTIAGSIDISRLTDTSNPEAALLPGIIPQAHRGIIFIDEINRLADTAPELTDILLDVMGNKPGHLQIEESGLPVVNLTVNVSIWAASNPDEDPGPLEEIRRQLSDRFDMVCYMGRPNSVDILSKILKDNAYSNKIVRSRQRNKIDFAQHDSMKKKIEEWAATYQKADLPDFLRNYIARLYIKHNIESMRAIEAMQQGALLYMVIKNRDHAMITDLNHVMPQVLKHRVDGETLVRVINDTDARGTRDSILGGGFGRRKAPNKTEEETEYFNKSGRSVRDMRKGELISTEKTLTPTD